MAIKRLMKALKAQVYLTDYAGALERHLSSERVRFARKTSSEGDAAFHIGWTLPRSDEKIAFVVVVDKSEAMVRVVCYKFIVGVPRHLRRAMLTHINALNARCTCFKFFLDGDGDVQMTHFFLYESPFAQFVPEEILYYIGRLVHFLDDEIGEFQRVARGETSGEREEEANG